MSPVLHNRGTERLYTIGQVLEEIDEREGELLRDDGTSPSFRSGSTRGEDAAEACHDLDDVGRVRCPGQVDRVSPFFPGPYEDAEVYPDVVDGICDS